jgi:hypothetical protein
MSQLWANLPWELRERAQWCIAGLSKQPLSINQQGALVNASVTEPSSWLTFDTAANIAFGRGLGIGYILHEDDDYSCIDFDIKDDTPRDVWYWMSETMSRFDSYTEHSRSGRGFHVWVKGKIGRGVRKLGVEIYSQERFIICTGNVVKQKPIEHYGDKLLALAKALKPTINGHDVELEELPEVVDDWYIYDMATKAENSNKFNDLWKGFWREWGYPSQSEADLSLLSMLTFYSKSNSQVRRMFRESMLGRREKAMRNDDYINRTLRTIRTREAKEEGSRIDKESLEAQKSAQVAELIQSMQGDAQPIVVQPLHVAPGHTGAVIPSSTGIIAAAAPIPAEVLAAGDIGIPWPPGIAGNIAYFMYQASYLPVKEISIASALAMLAGLCGKGWHVPLSGLNLYITLIARSAVGKEAMTTGLSALRNHVVSKGGTFFGEFISFSEYASGPALNKAVLAKRCFVNVSGEWGRRLKRMAHDDRDGPMTTLRTAMTNLYQKSSPQSTAGGLEYSMADNNVEEVAGGVAYSMLGETTPGTFYDSLTDTMMEDGFLSRFLNIEYTGHRVDPNRNIVLAPDDALTQHLIAMSIHANHVKIGGSPSRPVHMYADAQQMLHDYEVACGKRINGTLNETYRQMYNRAALKAQRVAALLAVADNFNDPVVTKQQLEWAIDIVNRDIAIMNRKIESGEVGVTDTSRERRIKTIIVNYLKNPLSDSYSKYQKLKDNYIIPRSYIQTNTARSSAFEKHKYGHIGAMDSTLKSMIQSGFLSEVEKPKMVEYGFSGTAFKILDITNYKEED